MKTQSIFTTVCLALSSLPLHAQQVKLPENAADVKAAATNVLMHPEYVRTLARMACVWGWPMINQRNRRTAITQAPQPGLINGVLPAAPRGQLGMLHDYIEPSETFVTCPNQDVVYGLGYHQPPHGPV